MDVTESPVLAVRLAEGDNVATLLEPAGAGAAIALRDAVRGAVARGGLHAAAAIPFGHKVALIPIRTGESVLKYGLPIGRATADISAGEHVHVHNVASGMIPAARGKSPKTAHRAAGPQHATGKSTMRTSAVAGSTPQPEDSRKTANPLPIPVTGFRRADGRVGIRNKIVVMAAAANMNPLIRQLAAAVPGVVCLPATYGRGQLGEDLEITLRTMAGFAAHPNVAGCLIVAFEAASAERIALRVNTLRREARTLSLLDEGGMTATFDAGRRILQELLQRATNEKRTPLDPRDLVVGLECGGSDTTSGLLANPSLGAFADAIIDAGGSAIFSEPVECLGGEALLERRAVSSQAAKDILATILRYRDIALSQGVDLTGVNPTADNIAGGLTTIEEKSLGAIAKSGHRPIQGVLGYGEPPPHRGLWLMEAPAEAIENLTAIAAAGAQLLIFVTGSGNPVGHPVAPTVKVCANPETVVRMAEHIDVDLSNGLAGEFDSGEGGRRIAALVAEVIQGRATAAERLGFLETTISRFGLSV